MARTNLPHPEERSQSASRRTHSAVPKHGGPFKMDSKPDRAYELAEPTSPPAAGGNDLNTYKVFCLPVTHSPACFRLLFTGEPLCSAGNTVSKRHRAPAGRRLRFAAGRRGPPPPRPF